MEQKKCKNCEADFEITKEDTLFYEKMKVPEPTLCPPCRLQRRIAPRNERSLYKRKCDSCSKVIISVYHPDSYYKAYCYDCWWGDNWDPMDYGRDYDFGPKVISFFEQFNELLKSTPQLALIRDDTSENCDYVNYGMNNKNCYLALGFYCEDIYYSDVMIQCKSCVNCHKCVSSELCFDCIDCTGCYNLLFSQDCFTCSDSYFLKDCVGCSNCFCSSGLRNAKFVFCNERLSEEEYKKCIKEIEFTNESIAKWKKELEKISLTIPKKYIHGTGNENVNGDYLDNCKNVKECYDCLVMQDSAYCANSGFEETNDMYDCTNAGIGSELCYETIGVSRIKNSKFMCYGNNLNEVEYSVFCYNCSNIFGCIGLRQKEYCIFNKQYTKEEYEKIIPRIKDHMMKTGEYGEFFPISISPFGYNETLPQDFFPLTKKQALEKGFKWRDPDEREFEKQTYVIPEKIKDVPDSILKEVLACVDCGRNYRIIKQELEFHRKSGLAISLKCPECRHKERREKRNPRKLYNRKCDKCSAEIKTTFAPAQSEIVYCEKCYLQEIV